MSRLGALQVRIIECEITIATTAGRYTGVYRLATTLLDPRRHPAFDLVIQAAVITGTVIDLIGAIGCAVLAQPMPSRRLRVSPRAVKRPLSRYAYKGLRVNRRTYKATIGIDILTIPLSP